MHACADRHNLQALCTMRQLHSCHSNLARRTTHCHAHALLLAAMQRSLPAIIIQATRLQLAPKAPSAKAPQRLAMRSTA